MGRPRNADVPSEQRFCSVQDAKTEHRQYRNGTNRDGSQRYLWTCTVCHAERNLAAYHRDALNHNRTETS